MRGLQLFFFFFLLSVFGTKVSDISPSRLVVLL